jgi:hypothetical protein
LLGIGLVGLAAACFLLRYLGIAPLGHDGVTSMIAYTPSAIGIVLAMVALFVFKPRVPHRSSELSVEQYWSKPEVARGVPLIWFLLEGAGALTAVGYFLTGEPVSAIAAGLTILAYWLCGPSVFVKT